MTRNIRLKIAYDGTDFCGWQKQENDRTVQGEIEAALEKIHGKHVAVTGCGRTDSGVHAAGQTANFFTELDSLPSGRFSLALNSLLPHDVRILDSAEADTGFHARFSAVSRTYRYQFICRTLFPHERLYNIFLHRFPDIKLLNSYGRLLLGETDCSVFAGSGDISNSKNRYIYNSIFFTEGEKLIFEIRANAFLRKMVRSVAGTFLHYEETCTEPERLRDIIACGKRSGAGPTLPPQGLFLWNVEY